MDVGVVRPWRFTGPDGVGYWSGLLQTGFEREVLNVDTVTIPAGEAVRNEFGAIAIGSRFPIWDAPGTSDPVIGRLTGKRVNSAANVAFLGVALENIPVGKTGRVGGLGTLCTVKSLASASLTNNNVGAYVFGSATAGAVDCDDTAAPTPGIVLGMVRQQAGAASGTQSDEMLGIEVNPH